MDGTLTAFAGELWIATGDKGEIRAALQAMGDDALDVALCEEVAARLARRQAVERLRLEEVMRAEVTRA